MPLNRGGKLESKRWQDEPKTARVCVSRDRDENRLPVFSPAEALDLGEGGNS